MVSSFLPKNLHFILKKNAILCLFVKNVSPSKRVVCFILNNSHLLMMKGISFYAKSRVLIIQVYQMKFKKSHLVSLSNFELNFFIVLWHRLCGKNLWDVVNRKPRCKSIALQENYRNFRSALYGNRVMRVPRYRRVDCISCCYKHRS